MYLSDDEPHGTDLSVALWGAGRTGKMSENESGEKAKKQVRRKPLWLAVPVSEREIERGDSVEKERLYTVQSFQTVTDVRKFLEDSEMDISNVEGVLLFRADAIPVETKLKQQIVIKFGSDKED